ncbi:MAG: hypothetical protein SGI99_09390 [Pseudomonadota bacterium]|nr:hypothetical protein [Pseudomonadota bacterium]
MLPANYPFELRPTRRTPWRSRLPRVFAIWISLTVHVGVLLHLLAPPLASAPQHRASAKASNSLQVILLDAQPQLAPAATKPPPAITRRPSAQRLRSSLATPLPMHSAVEAQVDPQRNTPTAADLFGSIEGAARALSDGDPRLPNVGMPSARTRLPGSDQAIIDLPLRFKRRPTPQQLTKFALRIFVATMAAYPDDMESVKTLRNPLQDLTDAHMLGSKEPECNDPDDPLRDPRCYPPPPR